MPFFIKSDRGRASAAAVEEDSNEAALVGRFGAGGTAAARKKRPARKIDAQKNGASSGIGIVVLNFGSNRVSARCAPTNEITGRGRAT